MIVKVYSRSKTGESHLERQSENLPSQPGAASDRIMDEALGWAVCNVIGSGYPHGFGIISHDIPSRTAGELHRMVRCSGRNFQVSYNADGTRTVHDQSRPDKTFEIVVTNI